MKLPDELKLKRTSYYVKDENDPEALAYCETLNYLYSKAKNGTLYVKFVDGDRKGSIAKVKVDDTGGAYYRPATIVRRRATWANYEEPFEIEADRFYGTAKWDKRKNSCQIVVPSQELVILPNYEGPTIYEMFDKKAAKAAALENPEQTDIDGKLLSVGDEVLYINARYGSGFVLCHGIIKEFKAVADSKGTSITTIVQLKDDDMLSAIANPSQMIWKK